MAQLAPYELGGLESSVHVSSRATSQRKLKRSDLEIFIGPRKEETAAIQQEFGNVNHPPQPFARPGWEQTKFTAFGSLKYNLTIQIKEATERHRRKAERLAAKMKRGR